MLVPWLRMHTAPIIAKIYQQGHKQGHMNSHHCISNARIQVKPVLYKIRKSVKHTVSIICATEIY